MLEERPTREGRRLADRAVLGLVAGTVLGRELLGQPLAAQRMAWMKLLLQVLLVVSDRLTVELDRLLHSVWDMMIPLPLLLARLSASTSFRMAS